MNKIIAILFTLVLVSACQTKPIDSAGTAAGAGSSHHAGRLDMGSNIDATNVEVGSQADLEVNVGDRIFFKFDSSTLNNEALGVLNKQAEWLKSNSNVTITIEGHCDERGTREYNLALGERRANVAKKYLVNAGIEDSRISVISYGKERPAITGEGEEVWSQNRRDIIVINQ